MTRTWRRWRPRRRPTAARTLRYRANVYDDLEPGSFDTVLVADLAPYVRAPALLAELARLVAKQGYLIGGLRNVGGLALWQLMEVEEGVPPTYGQLLDVLSAHFPHVEVATQSPLLGYQLAFERGEGLQVDGSLIRGGEAAYFVVMAGQEPARIVDPTWVQLPPEPLAFTRGRLEEMAQRAKAWEERAGKQKELVSKLRAELADREAEVVGAASEAGAGARRGGEAHRAAGAGAGLGGVRPASGMSWPRSCAAASWSCRWPRSGSRTPSGG